MLTEKEQGMKKCGCGCECGHDHHHDHSHEHHHHHEIDRIKKEHRVYIVEHVDCAHCAAKMEEKIRELPGVEMATLTFATKQLKVVADNQEELLPQIQKACASVEDGVTIIPKEEVKAEKHGEKKSIFAENKAEILTIAAGAVLFVGGEILEHLGVTGILPQIGYVIAYILLGWEIVWKALKNLVKGRVFDENFLMSVATLAAFAIGDFAEAVGVMLFYRIGELFEEIAVERSRSQIMAAVDMRPEVVNLVEEEEVREIPAGFAKKGDVVLIRPGDRIPLDGVIVEGTSRVDTSPVTGESVPVAVKPGTEVLSGCVNTQGMLKMRVEKPLEESMVTKILDSVENAAASKPKLDRFITKFARVYTPFVVVAAAATAVIPSLITGDWNHWIYTAITFLVISCPCALVLSVPLAFFSGIGAGSRKGILFKGGLAMEALKNIRGVVMDKTGTITKGEFRVQSVETFGDMTQEKILALAAACEQNSTHPIGNSIVEEAVRRELSLVCPSKVEELSGKGIHSWFPEGEVLCGNRALMQQFGVDVTAAESHRYGTEVLVAVNGKLEGYLVISDTLKEGAKESIVRLHVQNLKTVMLTGDTKESAEAIAKEAGVEEVYAQLLPQEKLEYLQKLREKYGSVMFVGDGINDAPVLAGADVGAAMGSGADAAIEAADVVFMTSAVEAIPESVRIAKVTGTIAMENVVFALAVKALVMILGFLGFANMWMAVFADTGVAMLCVLNAIRILYKKRL